MLGVAALVSLVPLVLSAPPVRLEVDGTCPDPARISDELAAILSSREEAPPPSDTARVTTHDGVLTVTLIGAGGALLGERELRADGDCDARARAVAVIVATFLADVHPEYLTFLPSDAAANDAPAGAAAPVADPPPAPAGNPAPLPPPGTTPPPGAAPARLGPSPATNNVLAPTPAPERAQLPNEWLLTAAVGAELNSDLVPAASISLSFVPAARGLGVRAFALVTGRAERALAADVASYSRFPFGIGPLVRFGQGDAWFDAGAGVALGWLHVAGRTFSSNTSADDVVVGPFASLRAGTEWLAFRPFAEVGALIWPGKSVLLARSPEASAELPAFEGFFLLGAGWSL